MARLTLNPNSYLTNKPHILAIDADGLYTLNRSISTLNNAVWGLQPTSADYLSGITIDRLKPLSSNTSLCSDIYQMDFALSTLKFFATRPFIMCENVEDMNSKARSPLAIYLTPLSAEPGVPPTEESEKEWLFFLPESISTFEDLAALYEASEDDPDFRLSSLIAEGGYWECIGTTALTESILSTLVFKNTSSEITGSLSVTNSFTIGGEGRATISAGPSSFYIDGYKMLDTNVDSETSGKIPFERLPMKSILSTSVTTDHGSGDNYVQQGIVAADSYYYKSNEQIVLSAHEDYPGTDVKPILEFEASLSTDSITPLLFNLPEYVGGDMNIPISVELKNLYGYYLTSWGAVDLDLSCFGNIQNGQVIELKRSQDPYFRNRYETVITAENGLSTKFMLDVGSEENPNESYRSFDIFIENEAPDEFDGIYFRQVDTVYDEVLTKSFDFIQTPAPSLPPYGQISISPLITYNQAKKILRKAVNIDSISAIISKHDGFATGEVNPRTTNEIVDWCKDLHLALSSLIVNLNG